LGVPGESPPVFFCNFIAKKESIMSNQKRLFLFFGFMVLLWSIFWQGALRIFAMRYPDSAWARGMLIDL
jgi:hypothetical protein